jgi:hypothetical protein
MINEMLKLQGTLHITLTDKHGNVKDQRIIKNLVVNTGLNFVASRMVNTSANVMSHMAIGTGTTSPAAGDTDLVSIAGARELLDSITVTDNAVTYVAAFEAGDQTGEITEAGIFNASTGGDMLCRSTFTAVTKEADENMSITWTITVSA